MTNILTREELIALNERMLGRGAPVQEDGIGYNKADYGACATYFHALSDLQYADLAKRLVKYSKTQLEMDREDMIATYKYYTEIAGVAGDRADGISLNITEDGTLISFRYNEAFIDVIKKVPVTKRRYDSDNKNWIVSNELVYSVLESLEEVGADIKNAIAYAMTHPIILDAMKPKTPEKVLVLTKIEGDVTYLKFDYNKDVVSEIKRIASHARKYNPQYKYWAIKSELLGELREHLCDLAQFRYVN